LAYSNNIQTNITKYTQTLEWLKERTHKQGVPSLSASIH